MRRCDSNAARSSARSLNQRTPERRGYANVYKPKTVHSRVGTLELAVPQARDVEFYPSALERGTRSERALALAVAEMYLQGVSTRKAVVRSRACRSAAPFEHWTTS